MARHGFVITVFYAVATVLLLFPGAALLAGYRPDEWTIDQLAAGIWVGILVLGEALLILLSVDSGARRFRQRRHLAFTATLAGFLIAVLFASAAVSFAIAMKMSDDVLFRGGDPLTLSLATFGALWCLWGSLFYVHYRGSPEPVAAAVGWLLTGSVLELLIAVPSHIVVHRRNDCTEPAVTSYGVVTGLAVMLLAFGPGILALYRKRIDDQRARRRGAQRR